MRGELDAVEAAHGERPVECPWRAFFQPDVVAVIQAYDFFESGQLGEWWGRDPEWWLVQAVRFYHRVMLQARADVAEILRPSNTPSAPEPPLGAPVPGGRIRM